MFAGFYDYYSDALDTDLNERIDLNDAFNLLPLMDIERL